MSYLIVCTAALLVAALTLFSGFGLGTLLMPVFAIFFPVKIAVAATAVVHLANNVFKVGLIGRWADWGVAALFAVPAAAMAVVGALLLRWVAAVEPVFQYEIAGRVCDVTAVKLVIALLIAAFTALDLVPRLQKLAFDRRYIPLGGALSGFFGGLSGHQGALRSAFLVRAGLDKEAFLGTVVVSAVVVDVSRLVVYGLTFFQKDYAVLQSGGGGTLVLAATLAAFAGSYLGTRLVRKVTMQTVHSVVGVMLLLIAVLLGTGLDGALRPRKTESATGKSTRATDEASRQNPSHDEAPATTGTIQGRVTYRGKVPKARTADDMGRHRDLLHVDPKSHGLEYAIAHLDIEAPREKPAEDDKRDGDDEKEPPTVVVDQEDFAFVPHLIAVRPGEPVRFTNSDDSNHNVRATSLEPANQFNVYTGLREEHVHRFRAGRKNRPVVLGCDIHRWMRGWVYVFEHPYYAVSDGEGKFRIPDVPPGTYRLVVRQPDGGLIATREVTVTAGKAMEIEVDFTEGDLQIR